MPVKTSHKKDSFENELKNDLSIMYKQLLSTLMIALLLMAGNVSAKQYTEYRTFLAPASEVNTLKISSRFGNIQIVKNNSDSIKVSVILEIDETHERNAEHFFKDTEISEQLSNGKYSLSTHYPQLKGPKKDFQVNYKIYAPDSIALDLQCKFGNIDLTTYDGKVKLKVAYGKLLAKDLRNASIEFDYASAEIAKLNDAKIKSNYSKIKLDSCETIDLSTKFSTFTIHDIKKLSLKGKGGQVTVHSIEEILAEGSHINYNIKTLQYKTEISNAFGNVDIQEVASVFHTIKIENEYGNILVNTNESSIYNLDVLGKYSEVSLKQTDNLTIEETEHQKTVYGVVGGTNTDGRQIQISSKYGSVQL